MQNNAKTYQRQIKNHVDHKEKIEAQCIVGSTIANPPAKTSSPPSPKSISGAYIPKHAFTNPPSNPHLPSSIPVLIFQHVPMLILKTSSPHDPFQQFHPKLSYHQLHQIKSIVQITLVASHFFSFFQRGIKIAHNDLVLICKKLSL